MKYFITGCAGFIGNNLTDRLQADGHTVTGYDNFSAGKNEFTTPAPKSPGFRVVSDDTLDLLAVTQAMCCTDYVIHLAANADVHLGSGHPKRVLEQNAIATYNVLETRRTNGVRRIAFSSMGSLYGKAKVIPTPEDAPFPVQISLYGASKLASAGLIQADCESNDFQG